MCFFVVKQKTAYEMRISDWSSDVCSSDLGAADGSVTLVGSGGVARSTGAIDSGTVSMTSASGLLIGGDISTSGDQEYAGAVGLVDDTTLSSAGNIQFESTVVGGHVLAVSAGGTGGFGGDGGKSVAF